MPEVDTPFIIGVIREKEKGLLQDDEYTRIVHAPTADAAVQVLVDTVYGVRLEQTQSPFEAIQSHLEDELEWLREVLEDKRAFKFIATRSQALEAATILFTATDNLPASTAWRTFVKKRQEADVRKQEVLVQVKKLALSRMERVAYTPLMQRVAELAKLRIETDEQLRERVSDTQGEGFDMAHAPEFLSPQAVENLLEGQDATQYEKEWDIALLRAIQEHRADPVGIDAVLSYWFAKELEVKTLRILLSAKLGGLAAEDVADLQRPLYLAHT